MNRQVKTRVFFAAAFLCAAVVCAEQPAAEEILRDARIAQGAQHQVLLGRLRHASDSIPFRLAMDGKEIRYEFTELKQTLRLRLGENNSQLDEIARGDSERVTAARFDQKFRNTDISYEDLTLHFLYWPDAELLGTEAQLARYCWKLRLRPPSKKDSQYGVMLVWIEKESGALLEADAFDWDGKMAKRFKVISAQKLDGVWLLKQMRIESFDAGKLRSGPPTYLEIQSVEP
jgi:Outer membrane lipoprotein-sorting protein